MLLLLWQVCPQGGRWGLRNSVEIRHDKPPASIAGAERVRTCPQTLPPVCEQKGRQRQTIANAYARTGKVVLFGYRGPFLAVWVGIFVEETFANSQRNSGFIRYGLNLYLSVDCFIPKLKPSRIIAKKYVISNEAQNIILGVPAIQRSANLLLKFISSPFVRINCRTNTIRIGRHRTLEVSKSITPKSVYHDGSCCPTSRVRPAGRRAGWPRRRSSGGFIYGTTRREGKDCCSGANGNWWNCYSDRRAN